jgi:hypothetical protein
MIAIDSAILDLTEWLCRRFQRLTGRTNVWLAVQLTNISIVAYFVWAALYVRAIPVGARIAVVIFCSGVLYLLTQTIFKVPIETSEHFAYHRVAKGLRNPRRLRDVPLRLSFLTLSVFLFYIILFVRQNFPVPLAFQSYPLVVLTTVLLYVVACDPLPPCEGTVKEWLRGLAASQLQVQKLPATVKKR